MGNRSRRYQEVGVAATMQEIARRVPLRDWCGGGNLLIEIRHTNARGLPVGESSPTHRFSDEEVARAREMTKAGATYRAVAAAIGCSLSTAWRWSAGPAKGRRFSPASSVRVILRPPINTPPCAEGARSSNGEPCGTGIATPTPAPTPVSEKQWSHPGEEFA